jgi:hypothetical protein
MVEKIKCRLKAERGHIDNLQVFASLGFGLTAK